MPFYLYAETAFHHEGDKDYLLKLIDLAAACGAKGVKFQVLTDPDYLVSSKHTYYDLVVSECFSENEWREILAHCNANKLDIIFMPINPEALELVNDPNYKVAYLDLHSVSFNDEATLAEMKKTGIPLILGVGGRTTDEIREKNTYFGDQLTVLMVGFQSFPTLLEKVNIEKISLLKSMFPDKKIGYADHSSFNDIDAVRSNDYAYMLGARFFEKHLTLNEGVERDDYESAVGGEKFQRIADNLAYLDEKVLNKSREELMTMNEEEIKYRNRERVCVAARDLAEGQVVAEEDLVHKMINKENGVVKKSELIGKKVKSAIEKDDIVRLQDLE